LPQTSNAPSLFVYEERQVVRERQREGKTKTL